MSLCVPCVAFLTPIYACVSVRLSFKYRDAPRSPARSPLHSEPLFLAKGREARPLLLSPKGPGTSCLVTPRTFEY